MADGQLWSIRPQLLYAKRALNQVRLVLSSEGYTFPATVLYKMYRDVSLYLGTIN